MVDPFRAHSMSRDLRLLRLLRPLSRRKLHHQRFFLVDEQDLLVGPASTLLLERKVEIP